jgi:hypothetical protein
MSNTYAKYTANVWLAKTQNTYAKGDRILIANKYGQEKESIVYNLILTRDGYNYYSIVRNKAKSYAQRKIEQLENRAQTAQNKSNDYYNKSNEHRDFLSLGEPIKVGHHSEGRHRRIIDQSWSNMGKSVEYANKAEEITNKLSYWEDKSKEINLSMPESLEYFKYLVERTKNEHLEYKSGIRKQEHSYSMTCAKKRYNEAVKNYDLAIKLWS